MYNKYYLVIKKRYNYIILTVYMHRNLVNVILDSYYYNELILFFLKLKFVNII
jgi:hypothetical protein